MAQTPSVELVAALDHCDRSADAVVAIVWPTAHSHVDLARQLLQRAGATITYEVEVQRDIGLGTDATAATALLVTQALYAGEDWLDSNCWYSESPLPGGPPSTGPFRGAQWKSSLVYRPQPAAAPGAVSDSAVCSSNLPSAAQLNARWFGRCAAVPRLCARRKQRQHGRR